MPSSAPSPRPSGCWGWPPARPCPRPPRAGPRLRLPPPTRTTRAPPSGSRERLPRVYSQDLLNNLFRHPYTKIEFVQRDLLVSRQTAARYLDLLAGAGFVEKRRAGRANYYVNPPLVALLAADDV